MDSLLALRDLYDWIEKDDAWLRGAYSYIYNSLELETESGTDAKRSADPWNRSAGYRYFERQIETNGLYDQRIRQQVFFSFG